MVCDLVVEFDLFELDVCKKFVLCLFFGLIILRFELVCLECFFFLVWVFWEELILCKVRKWVIYVGFLVLWESISMFWWRWFILLNDLVNSFIGVWLFWDWFEIFDLVVFFVCFLFLKKGIIDFDIKLICLFWMWLIFKIRKR